MTPCRNLVRHDMAAGIFGDCHRCCVAAILDLDPLEVPHFCQIEMDTHVNWAETLREFLSRFGLAYAVILYPGETSLQDVLDTLAAHSPGVPMILGGAAAVAPEWGHSVVVQDGRIIMDPSDSGIGGPLPQDGFWRIEMITVGPAFGGRLIENAA